MTIDETRFGEIRPDGSVREPSVSVISGRTLGTGDVRVQIKGSRYFVRVKAFEWRNMNQAEKRAMRDEWDHQVPSGEAPEIAPDQPAYDDMNMEELKAEAERRGVDLTGRRASKQHVADALRADDVARRFGPVSADSAETGDVTDGN